MNPPATLSTRTRPPRDTVLFDGQCRFCQRQVARLRAIDLTKCLQFTSLHDESVARDFPELSQEALLAEMFVVDRRGIARCGATAWRYLSRRLPMLWPLVPVLHVPGSLPLWNWIYRLVARNRYRLAGPCTDGTCRVN
jgi:predicted DCC family thiol-disulfide oxidoreductase YuxK